MQLGVLMENMVGAPQVRYRKDPDTGNQRKTYEEAVGAPRVQLWARQAAT